MENQIDMEFKFGDFFEAKEIVQWELGGWVLETDPNMKDYILAEYKKSKNKKKFIQEFEAKMDELIDRDGLEVTPEMNRTLKPILDSKKRRRRRRKRK